MAVHPQNCSLIDPAYNLISKTALRKVTARRREKMTANVTTNETLVEKELYEGRAWVWNRGGPGHVNASMTNKDQFDFFREHEAEGNPYGTWEVGLFSLPIMGSLLAEFDYLTFFTTISLVLAPILVTAIRWYTYMGFAIEVAKPRGVCKLLEAVHLHRHEENLPAEEETYYLVVEIIRSPELLRAMSGSRIRGSAAPELDGLSEKKKKKLEHLDYLQMRGFEVDILREKILSGQADIFDEDE